jgi:hypothetical protein
MLLLALFGAAAGVAADAAHPGAGLSFLERTLSIIRLYTRQTTGFVADVTLTQRVPGLTQSVKSECHLSLVSDGVLIRDIRSPFPYVVIVSNDMVLTLFTSTNERDERPLLPNETRANFMLGIPDVDMMRDYELTTRIDGDLQVLMGAIRRDLRYELARDVPGNAHRVISFSVWVHPYQRRIVRTQRVTLSSEETTCDFRNQNLALQGTPW